MRFSNTLCGQGGSWSAEWNAKPGRSQRCGDTYMGRSQNGTVPVRHQHVGRISQAKAASLCALDQQMSSRVSRGQP